MNRSPDQEADRIMQLLDVGLSSLRQGDGDSVLMALAEAVKTAKSMPQKPTVICLPDLSARIRNP